MTGEDAHKPEVTFEEFKEKLDTPQMKEYFKAVRIDPSEAAGIFKLLDMDNNGHLDRQEIVSGCLRLRGTAQALELSLLVYQITQMYNDMVENQRLIQEPLLQIVTALVDDLDADAG